MNKPTDPGPYAGVLRPKPQARHSSSRSPRDSRVRAALKSRAVFRRCGAIARRPLLSVAMAVGSGAMGIAAPATLAQQAEPLPAQTQPAQTQPAQEQPVQAQRAGININTAGAEELAAQLSGIGRTRAAAIVRYREQFGPFESAEELAEVSGIGMLTVERNRERIRLE